MTRTLYSVLLPVTFSDPGWGAAQWWASSKPTQDPGFDPSTAKKTQTKPKKKKKYPQNKAKRSR
jgi:hypothetical protein